MFKKILAIATVMCVIPMMASAATWKLSTRAMSQGGVIDSINKTGQAVIDGTIAKTYPDSVLPITVTVDPADGFKISKLSENGIISVPAAGTYTHTVTTAANYSVQATFARLPFSITATAGNGGSVNKTSYPVVYSGTQSPAKSFIFTPLTGKNVSSVTVTGAGVVAQNLNAITGLPISLPAPVNVKVKTIIATVGTQSVTVVAAFGGTATPFNTFSTAAGRSTNTDLARTQCVNCHDTQGVGRGTNATSSFGAGSDFYNWSTSGHQTNGHGPQACYICHASANTGAHPGNVTCNGCHADVSHSYPQAGAYATGVSCARCHTVKEAHLVEDGCIDCHASARNAGSQYVQDNNGVRSITNEFEKWSHHVTGVELNNSHCTACHLAGKQGAYGVHVDPTKHLADNKIHLRNADDDSDIVWDPASPNHTTMDNFCLTCHDANGATSAQSIAIQGYLNTKHLTAPGKTASATNPFGDTISNRYDKMFRPAVVNVDDQFDTTNNSHHGVKGPRYSGRTETAGPRQITGNLQANVSAALLGARSTIFDNGNFNALYVPLENAGGEAAPRTGAASLGDDSTLHCGDCHTVGQFKPNATVNMNGAAVATVIGAHGSNNEYMLRNSLGSDAKHQGPDNLTPTSMTYAPTTTPYLVCFNCHTFVKYGSLIAGGNPATASLSHAATSAGAPERCNGPGNTMPFGGYTTGTLTNGTQFEHRLVTAGSSSPKTYGNVFGMQCANCHNSGTGNAYGGIHGSANNQNTNTQTVDGSVLGGAYIDGMGNTTKIERFLPGLGNAMHVPGTLGGITGGSTASFHKYSSNGVDTGRTLYTYTTGGVSSDTNWEQKLAKPASGYAGAGCYTIGVPGDGAAANEVTGPSMTGAGGPNTQLFDTWGGCDDHNAKQGGGDHGFTKTIIRPVTY